MCWNGAPGVANVGGLAVASRGDRGRLGEIGSATESHRPRGILAGGRPESVHGDAALRRGRVVAASGGHCGDERVPSPRERIRSDAGVGGDADLARSREC